MTKRFQASPFYLVIVLILSLPAAAQTPPFDDREDFEAAFTDAVRRANLSKRVCPGTVLTVQANEIYLSPHLQAGHRFILQGQDPNDLSYRLTPLPPHDWVPGNYIAEADLFNPNGFYLKHVFIQNHAHTPDPEHRYYMWIDEYDDGCPRHIWLYNLGSPRDPIPDDPGHGGARN